MGRHHGGEGGVRREDLCLQMTIRAVIFDLGHTVWDITPQPEALAQAYVEFRASLAERTSRTNLPAPGDFQRSVRDVLVTASKTYVTDGVDLREPPPHEWVRDACARLGVVDLDEALLRELTPPLFATEIHGLVVSDGTREAIAELAAAGYMLGCITNTLADTASIRAMLRKYELEEMMSSVVVSTEEGWRKPHPSLFEKAMRELDALPGECAFVGDSPVHDIGGSKASGMFAVLTCQYVTRPYPDDAPPPDAVIDHLRELQDLLSRFEMRS